MPRRPASTRCWPPLLSLGLTAAAMAGGPFSDLPPLLGDPDQPLPDLTQRPAAEPVLTGDWLMPGRKAGSVTLAEFVRLEGGMTDLVQRRAAAAAAETLATGGAWITGDRSGPGADGATVSLYEATLAWNPVPVVSKRQPVSFSFLTGARAAGVEFPDGESADGPALTTPVPVGGLALDVRIGPLSSLRASVVGGGDARDARYFESRFESVWKLNHAADFSVGWQSLQSVSGDSRLGARLDRDAVVFNFKVVF